MKAIVCTTYGSPDVLHIQEIEKPIPGDNDVLVRVHSTSVNYGDLAARNFKNITPRQFNMPWIIWLMAKISFGLQKPNITILGSEFSGEIESTGKNVTRFKAGDPVFGYLGEKMGAYAEYLCMPETGVLAHKPANLTFQQAAAVSYGAIMALNLLRKVNVHAGQKVLVNGASGGIGSAAVQIAKAKGAGVTGVCGTPRLDFVRALGADRVIDYTREDFTKNGETYDLILDVLGRTNFSRSKDSLKPKGILLFASFKSRQLIDMLRTSKSDSRRVLCSIAPGNLKDLMSVKELIDAGKIKAIIDRSFPMEQAAEAHRYVEQGHKKGSVVITMNHGKVNQS